MAANCSDCGVSIPEGQRVCSMCYGDPSFGRDGIYAAWIEERELEAAAAADQEEAAIAAAHEEEAIAADPGRFVVGIGGSRNYHPDDAVDASLRRLIASHPEGITVVTGDEPSGVDLVAIERAKANGLPWISEQAYWDTEGKGAGHKRNGRVIARAAMFLAYFTPAVERVDDLLTASPGTCDAVTQALDKGIPVHAFHRAHWLPDPTIRALAEQVRRKWQRYAS